VRYQGWLPLLREIKMTTVAAICDMPPLMRGTRISSERYRLVARAIARPVLPRSTIPYFYFDRPAGGGPFE
jgi:hypothetical protein